jgi:hypothetical protein
MHTQMNTYDSVKGWGTKMAKKSKPPVFEEWAGWGLTPEEMQRRLARARIDLPIWATMSKERLESVDELGRGFRFRSSEALVRAFDYSRLPHRGLPHMSLEDREVYDRLVEWLKEMHDAGLRRYVTLIVGILINEDHCPDKGLFVRSIDLHVALRKRDAARKLQRRRGAGRIA